MKKIYGTGTLDCPWCKTRQTALAGRRAPRAGDFSICYECCGGAIIDFNNEGIFLRKPRSTSEKIDLTAVMDDQGIGDEFHFHLKSDTPS